MDESDLAGRSEGHRGRGILRQPSLLTPSRPLRVLTVTNMYPGEMDLHTGIYVKNQVELLRQSGVETSVFMIRGFEGPHKYLEAIPRLHAVLHEFQFDLLHAHYGLSGFVCACQSTLPMILTIHGSDLEIKWQRMISSVGIRKAVAVVVQNEKQRDYAGSKARIIPCGYDDEIFHPVEKSQARRRLRLSEEGLYALFGGSISKRVKNYPLFQRIMSGLQERDRRWTPLTFEDVSPDTMALMINACDVVIMTSWWEGSPVVAREAWACDRPVFAPDIGDLRTLLGSEHSRFILRRDPWSFVERIIDFVAQHDHYPLMRDVAQMYTLKSTNAHLLDLYAKVSEVAHPIVPPAHVLT